MANLFRKAFPFSLESGSLLLWTKLFQRSVSIYRSLEILSCPVMMDYIFIPCLVNESVALSLACEDADFTQPLLDYVESNCWICQNCFIDYSKLILAFVTAVPCISRPLPNKTKLKFDQEFKAY